MARQIAPGPEGAGGSVASGARAARSNSANSRLNSPRCTATAGSALLPCSPDGPGPAGHSGLRSGEPVRPVMSGCPSGSRCQSDIGVAWPGVLPSLPPVPTRSRPCSVMSTSCSARASPGRRVLFLLHLRMARAWWSVRRVCFWLLTRAGVCVYFLLASTRRSVMSVSSSWSGTRGVLPPE